MATATKARVSLEILEDRYEGLTVMDEDWTELQRDLSAVLGRLASRTARCHRDDVGVVNDELFLLIREHIVKRVDELGIAQ